MDKYSLFKLGALAQKVFNMHDGFEIIEAFPDVNNKYRVVGPNKIPAWDYICPASAIDFDEVTFRKLGNNNERFWVAYSERFNTLVIQEANAQQPRPIMDGFTCPKCLRHYQNSTICLYCDGVPPLGNGR